ncbi:MAG TPA: hypothetical protein VJM31_13630 [Vicinamibacterales bacterium]|nr:hypothetical protein [Vicinamibacterales bacterium]
MRTLTCVSALVAAAILCLASDPVRAKAAPSPITQRFLERIDTPPVSYRAVRRLEARTERQRISGWLEAVTELDSVAGFQYQVTSAGGSEYIRKHVLMKVLAAEQAAHRGPDRSRAALTVENYTFGEAIEGADGFLLVPITPKRRAEMLVNGVITLGPDADLIRVEGRLSKNPSVWTRRVEVVRRYGRANGVRVPIAMSSKAHVLFVGPSTFTMCIDYESVNGEPVDVRTSCS